MRISPVKLNYSIPYINQYRQNTQIRPINNITQLNADTVSFGRSASNGELLRKVIKYKIPDMYTGQKLLDGDILKDWLQQKVFSRPIKQLVKIIKPYKDTLHSVQRKVFEMVEKQSISKPDISLTNALELFAPKAQKELKEIQDPIFNELRKEASKLPEKERKEFNELMEQTDKKRNNIKIDVDFSNKDFRYKLTRIALEVKQRGIDEEIKAIDKLINMSKLFPKKNKIKTLSKVNYRKIDKINHEIQQEQATAIRKIEKYFVSSPLNQNAELQELITSSRNKVFKIPTIIPFKRKNFIHDLEKITKNLKDQKFAHKLIKIAQSLPTSNEEVSAFIMKEAKSTSDKIGYDLFAGSIATLDHLVPFSKGGKDTINNYGLTSAFNNSKRGNQPLSALLEENPRTYINCQKQIDRLIELSNNGTFKAIGLNKWYIINFANMMKKLSPEEKPLILDISRLK